MIYNEMFRDTAQYVCQDQNMYITNNSEMLFQFSFYLGLSIIQYLQFLYNLIYEIKENYNMKSGFEFWIYKLNIAYFKWKKSLQWQFDQGNNNRKGPHKLICCSPSRQCVKFLNISL